MRYAKFIVAAIGGATTAVIAILPEGTTTWNILTAVAAACTSLMVYLVPNATG